MNVVKCPSGKPACTNFRRSLTWSLSWKWKEIMGGRIRGEMSVGMERARERFEAWRRSRASGERIRNQLWTLAVKLASRHGLSRTAGALKLDYNSLKHRVETGGRCSGPTIDLAASDTLRSNTALAPRTSPTSSAKRKGDYRPGTSSSAGSASCESSEQHRQSDR
jgi:hypothetical protein